MYTYTCTQWLHWLLVIVIKDEILKCALSLFLAFVIVY